MKSAVQAVIASILFCSTTAVFAGDVSSDANVYRAPSASGLTGLLVMNTADTMGPGLTLAATGSDQNAFGTIENVRTATAALIAGFSENVELSVKAKALSVQPTGGTAERGMGDSEAMLKWIFHNQNENLPRMAIGLGGIFPTGDSKKGLTELEHWGLRAMLMASAEVPAFDDSFIGLYAEVQGVAIDKFGGTTAYTDQYMVLNFGLAFPISDDNHLQFIIERSQVRKKDTGFIMDTNYTAITPGLRWASDHFSLSAGVQKLNYENDPTTTDKYRAFATLGLTY
jgi:hypothetical protein